ncbi:hypothetical protein FB451DRAFT_1185955 [Mycena latifolia]|nr:hypothetical protein FB451DRAFT_1185955 [Mycena latifolia]
MYGSAGGAPGPGARYCQTSAAERQEVQLCVYICGRRKKCNAWDSAYGGTRYSSRCRQEKNGACGGGTHGGATPRTCNALHDVRERRRKAFKCDRGSIEGVGSRKIQGRRRAAAIGEAEGSDGTRGTHPLIHPSSPYKACLAGVYRRPPGADPRGLMAALNRQLFVGHWDAKTHRLIHSFNSLIVCTKRLRGGKLPACAPQYRPHSRSLLGVVGHTERRSVGSIAEEDGGST